MTYFYFCGANNTIYHVEVGLYLCKTGYLKGLHAQTHTHKHTLGYDRRRATLRGPLV